jgi:hypothetical protein
MEEQIIAAIRSQVSSEKKWKKSLLEVGWA